MNLPARINPVSINIETLQYLDSMIKSKNIASILEFGSGVSTEFWSEKLPDATVISFDNSRNIIQNHSFEGLTKKPAMQL